MTRPRLFLSAVSEELRTARLAVARTVRTLGFDPVSQDDFPTGYGELRQWLLEQLDSSEGLIQLVGDGCGAEPPEVDPDYGRISYTQFEFLYAHRQKKKTWIIVIGMDFPRDKAPDQLDLPRDSHHPDPLGYQTERRVLQQEYVAQLKRQNHLRHAVTNPTELDNCILRLRDELGELRKRAEQGERRLTRLVMASLVGVLVLVGGGWWGYQQLDRGVHEVGAVTKEKVRVHLRQATEDTYRREVAEADAATDWWERQLLREAADDAQRVRLSRVEEVAQAFAEIEGRGTATSVFQEMTRILSEQGVDEAIAYVGTQQASIFETVRARAATVHERNRADLQPLLQTAALHEARGQATEARMLYAKILAVEPDWPEALHASFRFHVDQGQVGRVRATLTEMSQQYDEAHRLAQHLTNIDSGNSEWQRDLSISHNRIGDVLVAQGDLPGALTAYQASFSISEALVKRDDRNTEWQRDLSVSHNKIGEVLAAQKDLPGALEAYRASLAIREALVKRDDRNTEWQRDLSVSHNRIGDVLMEQEDLPGALEAYRASFSIAKALVKRDGGNIQWQRDLSVSHNKIGDVLMAQKDLPGALEAYRASLAIREALVRRDDRNTEWQRDLSVSHNKIGEVLAAQKDLPGALEAYRASHTIFEILAKRDPENSEWQRDLLVSYVKLSEVASDKSYIANALEIVGMMQKRGTLQPRDAWMVDDLKRRAGQ